MARAEVGASALPAVLTVSATPHAGKTSLIMALVDQLRDQLNMAVVLGPDATAAEVEKFEATGIPTEAEAFRPDADGADGLPFEPEALARLDVAVREVPAGHPCDLWLVSAAEAPDASVPDAAALVVNKIDTVGSAPARDALAAAVAQHQPQAAVFLTSATTGAGLEPLAHWLLQRLQLA